MKNKDILISAVFGVIVWVAGVVLYRTMAMYNLFKVENMALIFAVAAGASLGAIFMMDKILKFNGSKLLPLISIASAVAIFIDSLVLVYFPSIYSPDQIQSLYIGAALLNGTATLTIFAVIYHIKNAK